MDQKEIEIISPDLEHFEYLPRNAHKSQKSVMNVYFYKSYEDNLFWQSLKWPFYFIEHFWVAWQSVLWTESHISDYEHYINV